LRLTYYGRDVVLKMLAVTLVLDIAAVLVPYVIVKLVLFVLSMVLITFTLYFFRDPIRHLPAGIGENDIISPGDGKVMMIEEIEETEFLKSKAKHIAIFLSPFNVHVNRIPLSGKIGYFRYVKGEYIVAFDHASAERNERTVIGIDNSKYRIIFKQIAGYVARRIVCKLKEGDQVKIGDKFGMIKFGSRVDVILPENSVIKVSVNQKVIGGETVLAEVRA
jgi:phosphatidylserine decarboxylase